MDAQVSGLSAMALLILSDLKTQEAIYTSECYVHTYVGPHSKQGLCFIQDLKLLSTEHSAPIHLLY